MKLNSKEVIVLVFFILEYNYEYIRADIETNALTTDNVNCKKVYVC